LLPVDRPSVKHAYCYSHFVGYIPDGCSFPDFCQARMMPTLFYAPVRFRLPDQNQQTRRAPSPYSPAAIKPDFTTLGITSTPLAITSISLPPFTSALNRPRQAFTLESISWSVSAQTLSEAKLSITASTMNREVLIIEPGMFRSFRLSLQCLLYRVFEVPFQRVNLLRRDRPMSSGSGTCPVGMAYNSQCQFLSLQMK
jgi:hypothetical protein